MKPFAAPQVLCRRALAADKAGVLEFTKSIWEGHDYIQYVWDDWSMDLHGILVTAEYAGHAVAIGKLSRVSAGQWWLEGLRVDPKYQGLKIGSHMHEYLQDWWSEREGGTVRLMTSWERVQVQHLCDRLGWKKIGEVRSYAAQAEAGEDACEPLREQNAARVASLVQEQLAPYGGLIDWGWRFSAPDEEVLRGLARDERLWSAHGGVLACWQEDDEEGKRLGIGFAAVGAERLTELLMDARRLAHRLGYGRVVWLAPALPWVEAAIKEAGYETDWDGRAYIYEKKR